MYIYMVSSVCRKRHVGLVASQAMCREMVSDASVGRGHTLDGLALLTALHAGFSLHAGLVAQLSLSNLGLLRCRLDELLLTTSGYMRY
jgi:hypothetical protein